MVGINTESRVKAVRRFFKSFPIRAFQGDSFEQDDLDEIKAPNLERLKGFFTQKLNIFELFS